MWWKKTIYLLVGSSVVCGNVRKSGLTWAQCWTKYKFASSDMILTISQLLYQVWKHPAAKLDRHHPKSQVGTLYASRECLFPETCQHLCRILSPVPAAWLLPAKEGWPVLLSMFISLYSTVLPQFTAFSQVWEINPQPQDTTESQISDCGNLSGRVYLQVYLQVLHDPQTMSQIGFALLLLYLTTLLRKGRKTWEKKWNIFTSGIHLQEASHSQKKMDVAFL